MGDIGLVRLSLLVLKVSEQFVGSRASLLPMRLGASQSVELPESTSAKSCLMAGKAYLADVCTGR